MENSSEIPRMDGHLKTVGWIISIVGAALYCYGYFADGGPAIIEWPLYLPDWAVQFVPNWQAESGFALSIVGAIPIYYVEFRNL